MSVSLKNMADYLINEVGMRQREVAEAIGTSQSAIHRIQSGGETFYTVGKKLEDLYRKKGGPQQCAVVLPDCA
jgi:predicted transcriptional regulator